MLHHYLGQDSLTVAERNGWIAYLNSWQDPDTGLFLGPELRDGERRSQKHSPEHLAWHLTAHVLPALELLGGQPGHELTFAQRFLDASTLSEWLHTRDWRDAWLEGNNLLFVGQFLIHLREVEGEITAQPALERLMTWLDQTVDPASGLWGTNGYCSRAAALYGGYHQLLLYYHEGRPVTHPQRLVDVALSLQHADGGFNLAGGGGACEDVDAVDILVNQYKRLDYRRPTVRQALRRALQHIAVQQMPDGGFVYRRNAPFVHMGLSYTASPANHSNLFPTWFRVHTLALLAEVLTDEPVLQADWQFNRALSMGWHEPWDKATHSIAMSDRWSEELAQQREWASQRALGLIGSTRGAGRRAVERMSRWGSRA
jgi:hypothetical protein